MFIYILKNNLPQEKNKKSKQKNICGKKSDKSFLKIFEN